MPNKVGDYFNRKEDIRSYLPNDSVVSKGLVGVEVELEGMKTHPSLKYWDYKSDGSLREGGVEYVLKQPLSGEDLVNSLEELETNIGPYKPTLSHRTSVHVHIDVRDLSPESLFRFIQHFVIFERTLLTYCGDERKGNIFCLPFYEAEGNLNHINFTKKGDSASIIHRNLLNMANTGKYAALNLKALETFGSLEIRIMHGEYRKEEILRWVNILLSIKESSLDLSEKSISTKFSTLGPMGFLANTFKGLTEYLAHPTVEEELWEGVRLAQDLEFKPSPSNTKDSVLSRIEEGNSEIFKTFLKKNYPSKFEDNKHRFEKPMKEDMEGDDEYMLTLAEEETRRTGINRPATMTPSAFVRAVADHPTVDVPPPPPLRPRRGDRAEYANPATRVQGWDFVGDVMERPTEDEGEE